MYRPTGRPLRSRPRRRSMMSASIAAWSRCGGLLPPCGRDFPRPPRRRFFFAASDDPDLAADAATAGATGAGRVSPIRGLAGGAAGADGRCTSVDDDDELTEPVPCPSAPAGFLRFFPPREPRRRFFAPCPSGRGPDGVEPVWDCVVSSAGDCAPEPLVSISFSFPRRTEARHEGHVAASAGATGPFGLWDRLPVGATGNGAYGRFGPARSSLRRPPYETPHTTQRAKARPRRG